MSKEWLLCACLLVHGAILTTRSARAASLFRKTFGLDDDRRRAMIYGPLYSDIAEARRLVPEHASVWWVSPGLPWLVGDLLYPRLLLWGSPKASEREDWRRKHPADWVVGLSPDGKRLALDPPASP